MLALKMEKQAMVELLVKKGCDIMHIDLDMVSTLSYAKKGGECHRIVKEAIREYQGTF